MAQTTLADLRAGLDVLGLSGRPVCVHSSLRSFGQLAGGAGTVLDALLAEGCTVLVPAFVYENQVRAPAGVGYARNGSSRHEQPQAVPGEPGYSTAGNEIDPSMGAIPRALLQRAGRVRGDHPLNAFAALGPLAATLTAGQTPIDVYAPLRALAQHNGAVLLIGVGLTNMTLLHQAERAAGRELFRRWAVSGGQVVETAVGSCSEGFEALAPALAPIRRSTMVGLSKWQAFNAAAAIRLAAAAIVRDPNITHCDDADCERCNDAVLGGPIIDVDDK